MYDDIERKIQFEIDEQLKKIDEDMKHIKKLNDYLLIIKKAKQRGGILNGRYA